MKKTIIWFTLLSFVVISHPQQKQNDYQLVEKMKIKWWIVPFYALDQAEKAVLDLTKADVTLSVNRQKIENFYIFKKTFQTRQTQRKEYKDTDKRKVSFLIFDTTLSAPSTIVKSKYVASKLISESLSNNYFILLSITPFKGLVYHIGPINDKKQLIKAIKQKITVRRRPQVSGTNMSRYRGVEASGQGSDVDQGNIGYRKGDTLSRMTNLENSWLLEQQRRSAQTFLRSLYNLNVSLKTFMGEGKVIYLFSTGITKTDFYSKGMVAFLKGVAKVFNQNGAMIFLVNADGNRTTITGPASGEASLSYLAHESGGSYLKGTKKNITRQIVEMDRGYYDIGFPEPEGMKTEVFDIRLKSNRSGVNIHAIRQLSRGKEYTGMSDIERELLSVNMVENGYWAKSKYNLLKSRLKTVKKADSKKFYSMDIPRNFRNNEMDVFHIWYSRKLDDAKIRKKNMIIRGDTYKAVMQEIKEYQHFIVMIPYQKYTALIASK